MKNTSIIITNPNPALYISHSLIHGRGVFSKRTIKSGERIESCPVIKMKMEELFIGKFLVLNFYAFLIDEQKEYCSLPLGFGCLYNHAENFNATYYYDAEKELMIFEARQKILKHEEITINYLGEDSQGKSIESWIQKDK